MRVTGKLKRVPDALEVFLGYARMFDCGGRRVFLQMQVAWWSDGGGARHPSTVLTARRWEMMC